MLSFLLIPRLSSPNRKSLFPRHSTLKTGLLSQIYIQNCQAQVRMPQAIVTVSIIQFCLLILYTRRIWERLLGCPAPLKEPMSVILKNADFIVLFFCSEFKIYVNRYFGSKGIYIALISSNTRAIILSRRFSPLIKIGCRGDEVGGQGVDGQEFLQHAEFVETGER